MMNKFSIITIFIFLIASANNSNPQDLRERTEHGHLNIIGNATASAFTGMVDDATVTDAAGNFTQDNLEWILDYLADQAAAGGVASASPESLTILFPAPPLTFTGDGTTGAIDVPYNVVSDTHRLLVDGLIWQHYTVVAGQIVPDVGYVIPSGADCVFYYEYATTASEPKYTYTGDGTSGAIETSTPFDEDSLIVYVDGLRWDRYTIGKDAAAFPYQVVPSTVLPSGATVTVDYSHEGMAIAAPYEFTGDGTASQIELPNNYRSSVLEFYVDGLLWDSSKYSEVSSNAIKPDASYPIPNGAECFIHYYYQ